MTVKEFELEYPSLEKEIVPNSTVLNTEQMLHKYSLKWTADNPLTFIQGIFPNMVPTTALYLFDHLFLLGYNHCYYRDIYSKLWGIQRTEGVLRLFTSLLLVYNEHILARF